MPRAYFDPENLEALAEVFAEAKRHITKRGIQDPALLDDVARRILNYARDGMPPWLILSEVLPPLTPDGAGLPIAPPGEEILLPDDMPETSKPSL